MSPREPIIVVGAPRSGTGMLTKILVELGIFMGDQMMSPNMESRFMKYVSRSALDNLGCTWRNPSMLPSVPRLYKFYDYIAEHIRLAFRDNAPAAFFGRDENKQLWGWKDPRVSLILPCYHRVFPKAIPIHIYRKREDVALSNLMVDWSYEKYNPDFYANNGGPRTSYLHYSDLRDFFVSRIEESLPHFERSYTVSYEDILADPTHEVTELAEFLNRPAQLIPQAAAVVSYGHIGRYNQHDLSFMEGEEEKE